MNNISIEQRREAFNVFLKSDEFNDALEKIVNNRYSYYEWIRKYVSCGNNEITDNIIDERFNHIYRNMIMDNNMVKNTSLIYFIRNKSNGLLKIGKTNNLSRRIGEIKKCFNFLGMEEQNIELEAITYCPFNMNNSQVESYYHNLFKAYRVQGEWFNVTYQQLFENLEIRMIIGKTLIEIAEPLEFPKGVKNIKFIEKDKTKLREVVKDELIKRFSKYFDLSNEDIFHYLLNIKDNYISPKDLYDYLMNVENLNLEEKIFYKINEILREVA